MTEPADEAPLPSYDELVLKHNEIVEYLERETAIFEAKMKPYQEGAKAILAALHTKLLEDKFQNVKSRYGTPYLHTSTSVKVDNRGEFLKYVTEQGRWDMLDARALKEPVEAFIDHEDNKEGVAPPGVTYTKFTSCRIKGKKTETA